MEEHLATWVNAIVHAEPEALRPFFSVNTVSGLLVIAVLMILVRVGTRNMQLRPRSGWQVAWEFAVEGFTGFAENVIGPGGAQYAPFLGTVFIYVVALNLLGVVPGFISPTASLTMTLALSLVTVGYVQVSGVRAQGWRYLLHFVGEPLWLAPLNIPIHIIGEIARIISLAVRLFGNIFGEDTVIIQLLIMSTGIYAATHIPLPLHFPMVLFHIFVSFVQALVFMMLSAAYIAGAVHHEEHDKHGHGEALDTAARACKLN